MLDRYFQLSANGTNVRTEVMAGITTFLTMAYIIFVNPEILAAAGMPKESVFIATCLAAAVGSAIMGLYANYPIAVAPGMGLNAYFAFTVVQGMGFTWQAALGAVFLSGILFIFVSLFRIREAIVDAIPRSLKFGISAGIGLFLGIIGMKNAGIIAAHPSTLLTIGNLNAPETILAVIGFVLIVALEYLKVRGAIIISILGITLTSVLLDLTPFVGIVAMPPSIAPTFMQLDISGALNAGIVTVVMTFFMVELFDASGTLIGVCHRAGLLDADGKLPRLKKALLADSGAIAAGALLGTSSSTAYGESAAGTAVGGRTGLTAVIVALLFLAALVFAPLAGTVPAFATAPTLCYVAVLMTRGLAEIDWDDMTETAPAVVTAISMPFTFSIAHGIAFGFITYAAIKILAGRFREISPMLCLLAVVFILKFAFL